jgi:hypothetical protein
MASGRTFELVAQVSRRKDIIMISSKLRYSVVFALAVGMMVTSSASAFSSGQHPLVCEQRPAKALGMSNFFDDFGSFLQNMGNSSNTREDEEDCLVTTRLLELSADRIKPGGLRLFLMLYLMGIQNTPDQHSWSVDQPTVVDYAIDCYYHDRTAALMIRLTNTTITLDRLGSTPSVSYMMQESIIVDGLLDELSRCAFDDHVADEHRLLMLPEPKDAIEKARRALAFG